MKCCNIKNYHLYLKLFKQNSSFDISTIYWQDILILIKLKSLLVGNIIDQALKRILKLMSKAVIFVYL